MAKSNRKTDVCDDARLDSASKTAHMGVQAATESITTFFFLLQKTPFCRLFWVDENATQKRVSCCVSKTRHQGRTQYKTLFFASQRKFVVAPRTVGTFASAPSQNLPMGKASRQAKRRKKQTRQEGKEGKEKKRVKRRLGLFFSRMSIASLFFFFFLGHTEKKARIRGNQEGKKGGWFW